MQESKKTIENLQAQVEKNKVSATKIKSVASGKRDLAKEYQKVSLQLAETESLLENKCFECKELSLKLEKLKKKAKKAISQKPQVVENTNEEIVQHLNDEIDKLTKKIRDEAHKNEEANALAESLRNEINIKNTEVEMLKEKLQNIKTV